MHLFSRGPKQNFVLVADFFFKLQKSVAVQDSISTRKTW